MIYGRRVRRVREVAANIEAAGTINLPRQKLPSFQERKEQA